MSIDKCHTLSQTDDSLVDELVDQCVPLYEFSAEKNQWLLAERNISFKLVIEALRGDRLIVEIDHPNQEKYPHQSVYVVNMNGYAYMVPFVQKDAKTVFLKTVIPSRKFTKKYLPKQDNNYD